MKTVLAPGDPPDGPVWFGAPAAAKYLGLTLRTIYRRIDTGELPAYRMGRVIRLRRADIEDWLEQTRIAPGDLRHLYDHGQDDEGGEQRS